MPLSDDVKARVSLRGVVEAVARPVPRLSQPGRGEFWFYCPLHGGDSFHVSERPGELGRWYCHGCQRGGSVIDFVMAADGVSFADAVRRLAAEHGIAAEAPAGGMAAATERWRVARSARAEAEEQAARHAEGGVAQARAIWAQAKRGWPLRDGRELLTAYLAARTGGQDGMPPPPESLRVAELPAKCGHRGPAMVAAVGRGRLVGVHRTWITPEGRAVSRGEKVAKQMLGPCFGHPVRLTPAASDSVLVVGEGIETTLAVTWALRQAIAAGCRLPAWLGVPWSERWPERVSAEAALSLGALAGPATGRDPASGRPVPSPVPDMSAEGRRAGWLPPQAHRGPVIVLADPSAKAPVAAAMQATRAVAKIRASRPDLDVALAIPRESFAHAEDFADLAASGRLHWGAEAGA